MLCSSVCCKSSFHQGLFSFQGYCPRTGLLLFLDLIGAQLTVQVSAGGQCCLSLCGICPRALPSPSCHWGCSSKPRQGSCACTRSSPTQGMSTQHTRDPSQSNTVVIVYRLSFCNPVFLNGAWQICGPNAAMRHAGMPLVYPRLPITHPYRDKVSLCSMQRACSHCPHSAAF